MAFLKEVEQPGLGVELSIADDFVGGLTKAYECGTCNGGRGPMVFARKLVEGSGNCGGQVLPRLSKYTYLGGDLSIFSLDSFAKSSFALGIGGIFYKWVVQRLCV